MESRHMELFKCRKHLSQKLKNCRCLRLVDRRFLHSVAMKWRFFRQDFLAKEQKLARSEVNSFACTHLDSYPFST